MPDLELVPVSSSVEASPAAAASPSTSSIKTPVATTDPPPAAAKANTQPIKAGTTTSGNSVGIQWVILVVLSAIPIAIYAFAPSYGNTILTAFYTTIAIFGGILCLIAAVSIMMNIYKTDGTPIMIMMGFLGAFASPFIVFGYWIYHLWAWTQSVKPRPYFGLFPIGFHGSPGSFWDSFLAPFHNSSNDKTYEFLLADAKSILYGNPRD
jgi:hypothetical protein